MSATESRQDLSELALAARGGGESERLWGLAGARLTRIGLALGVPPQDVADLVQETLLVAHRSLYQFDPALGTFEAWIGAILVRKASNGFRASRRRRRFLELFRTLAPSGGARIAPEATRLEARLILDHLLSGLTDSQRRVIALYEIGELSAEETARILGITPAGVRSIARDARASLTQLARRVRAPFEAGS